MEELINKFWEAIEQNDLETAMELEAMMDQVVCWEWLAPPEETEEE